MTRIVAGTARGRRLQVPAGDVRPTADRVREAVFSALEHRLPAWPAVAVLDAFAGSGAMGLEAASRGSEHVVLVERDRRAAAIVRANAEAIAPDAAQVVVADAWRLGPRDRVAPGCPAVGLIVVDPPYREPDERIAALLDRLLAEGWLAGDCLAVVERSVRAAEFIWSSDWNPLLVRDYAQTRIHLARLLPSSRQPVEERNLS